MTPIDYVKSHRDLFLDELYDFLRIPSVSTDPERTEDVRAAAEFVADQLKKSGMTRAELIPTGGHPIVYGERIIDPAKPTVLVYGHYDVQPVDPIELWESGPFEPEVRDGKLYARGAADDKGQMFIHFKAAQSFIETTGSLPLNMKFLIEGEEEIGSAHLESFVQSNLDMLEADVVMISDTSMFGEGIPSICYGLRGLAYLEVEVIGPSTDLHSGSFGGPVANPAFVLAQMLASLKDETDHITVPGFYDNVRELTSEEREEFASLPFDREVYQEELGVKALGGEVGFTPLEQLWARPTMEINGLLSGFTGEGAKTVLPSRAMAKVSMRLVPNQDPERIADLFEEYMASIAPPTVEVKLTRVHGGNPWVAPLDHPALQAASVAVEKGFGKKPVFQREGGSIPIVSTFEALLGVPSVLMGIGLPGENAHAPNEYLSLTQFDAGLKAAVYFLEEFAKRE